MLIAVIVIMFIASVATIVWSIVGVYLEYRDIINRIKRVQGKFRNAICFRNSACDDDIENMLLKNPSERIVGWRGNPYVILRGQDIHLIWTMANKYRKIPRDVARFGMRVYRPRVCPVLGGRDSVDHYNNMIRFMRDITSCINRNEGLDATPVFVSDNRSPDGKRIVYNIESISGQDIESQEGVLTWSACIDERGLCIP